MFRLNKPTVLESEDLRRMGRLEAQVETLQLQWVNYRDEIKKLVNRLEKREQRYEQKLRDLEAETGDTDSNGPQLGVDEITERVMRRRNRALS